MGRSFIVSCLGQYTQPCRPRAVGRPCRPFATGNNRQGRPSPPTIPPYKKLNCLFISIMLMKIVFIIFSSIDVISSLLIFFNVKNYLLLALLLKGFYTLFFALPSKDQISFFSGLLDILSSTFLFDLFFYEFYRILAFALLAKGLYSFLFAF